MKTMWRKRKIMFAIGIAILIFIIWNLSWLVFVNFKYKPYTETVPKDKYGTYHIVGSEGYNFNVKKPDYLSLTGNLGSVAPDDICSLIIWPKVFGGYKYGLRIQDNSGGYDIMVDSNGNPIRLDSQSNEEFEKTVEIIQKNKVSIQKIFDKVKSQWDLS
ncbi:hypothetical protein LOZ80_30875 [Paenibacillus sp. HWE-109]|uniref:hypothetical protein n=1 Tax=Paenibacillus sp. HWE-109 TaxID=1306526 RepID=UPI001EDC9DB5|nr:hypothetical protein [Paenibacillus sp. HWE-109]UKS25915.1 hypothetical protein LOZ80_30875 [Paenibacillus sp. HWE-109]